MRAGAKAAARQGSNYHALTHELVDQVVADLKSAGISNVHPVRGRGAPGMCVHENIDELAADIAAAGLSVQAVLCGNPDRDESAVCPHFDSCPYQIQRRTLAELKPEADQPLVLVQPHPYLVRWPSFLPEPDARIVDESCWQQFVEKSKLQFADLLRIANHAPPAAQRVLRLISTALGDGPLLLKSLRGRGLTKRVDFKPAKSWLSSQIKERSQKIVESGSLNFRALQPWAAARHLANQLSLEIAIDREICHSVAFPDCESPNTTNMIGIYSHHPVRKDVPTILLDASAAATMNSQIFGKITTHKIEARRNARIYQAQRKGFSRQSITGIDSFRRPHRPEDAERLRREILHFIIGRLESHKRILVVAQLAVAQFLEGALRNYIDSDRIRLTHFNALRGLNSFEDCEAAIVIGRVQPSPGAVEALARGIYWDDPKPLLLGYGYGHMNSVRRMADGSVEMEQVMQHPDPRINAILMQLREREIEQAIDRLRLIYNDEPKDVYILTNIPIDAEITATATWSQFCDVGRSRLGQAILQSIEKAGAITVNTQKYEAAVLPFGRELGRCFPEIWPSLDSAKGSWDDAGGVNGVRIQIQFLFGNTPIYS